MNDKNPEDMTASELLRSVADRCTSTYTSCISSVDLLRTTFGVDMRPTYGQDMADTLLVIADKIDAELADARANGISEGVEVSLFVAAKAWAKDNGWPDFKECEDFGAWLERCAYKKPVDDHNEPVQFGEEIELHHRDGDVDKGRFQEVVVNKGPVWMLSFTGVDHEHLHRYDSECDVLKRPAPEVLGADGKPIVAGETVYDIYRGESIVVKGISRDSDGNPVVWGESNEIAMPHLLTHTPPDTQEKIDSDALNTFQEYWNCVANVCEECPSMIGGKTPTDYYECAGCLVAQKLDLLRRQRLLDGVAK